MKRLMVANHEAMEERCIEEVRPVLSSLRIYLSASDPDSRPRHAHTRRGENSEFRLMMPSRALMRAMPPGYHIKPFYRFFRISAILFIAVITWCGIPKRLLLGQTFWHMSMCALDLDITFSRKLMNCSLCEHPAFGLVHAPGWRNAPFYHYPIMRTMRVGKGLGQRRYATPAS